MKFATGETLATKQGSVTAARNICQLIEVPFDEDKMLTWESLDQGIDPRWKIPVLQKYGNDAFGFFDRASGSTHFEDTAERQVDLETVRANRPEVAACIDHCTKIYEKILNHPRAKILVDL